VADAVGLRYGRVAPSFQLAELADLRAEQMDQDIAGVDQDQSQCFWPSTDTPLIPLDLRLSGR
jgi:hypothetical protein